MREEVLFRWVVVGVSCGGNRWPSESCSAWTAVSVDTAGKGRSGTCTLCIEDDDGCCCCVGGGG